MKKQNALYTIRGIPVVDEETVGQVLEESNIAIFDRDGGFDGLVLENVEGSRLHDRCHYETVSYCSSYSSQLINSID